MNVRLNSINARLKTWHLSGKAQPQKTLVNDIYKDLFPGDFYREIWDEPILLALQSFMEQNPPNEDVYGSQIRFLGERTAQVKVVNDLFATLLLSPSDELPVRLTPIAENLQISSEMARLQANGALGKIRDSHKEAVEKLSAFVELVAEEAPGLSARLTHCLEAASARQELGTVSGLVIAQSTRIGMVLPVRVLLQPGSGQVKSAVTGQDTFTSAVQRAHGALQSRGFLSATSDVIFSADLTDATYSGSSITLAAALAMFSTAREWRFDPYTAFTGDIDIRDGQWHVLRVDGIPEKLAAAQRSGIRRVILPRQNENDAPKRSGLDLIFVDDIGQVLNRLVLPQHSLPADTVQQRKIVLLNTQCSHKGWQLSAAKEIQNGVQFVVTPATASELTINIYSSGTHTPKQHQRPEFQDLLQELNTLDSADIPLQSVQKTFNLMNAQLRKQVKEQFETMRPSEVKTEQYCDYSYVFLDGNEKLVVKQHSTGRMQLQGYAGPLYRHALEIIVPQYNLHFPNATLNIADFLATEKPKANKEVNLGGSGIAHDTSVALPHIGTDESGKGDYFGPLVVAGVWVDESLQSALAKLGVRDSKQLSDAQCQKLAASIREMCPGNFQVIEILPEKYNQFRRKFCENTRSQSPPRIGACTRHRKPSESPCLRPGNCGPVRR